MATEGRPDRFQIGKRNYLQLRSVLWKAGVLLANQDVGGKCLPDGLVQRGLRRDDHPLRPVRIHSPPSHEFVSHVP